MQDLFRSSFWKNWARFVIENLVNQNETIDGITGNPILISQINPNRIICIPIVLIQVTLNFESARNYKWQSIHSMNLK